MLAALPRWNVQLSLMRVVCRCACEMLVRHSDVARVSRRMRLEVILGIVKCYGTNVGCLRPWRGAQMLTRYDRMG